MIEECLSRVTSGATLSSAEARGLIESIVTGDPDPMLVAALLAALRTRGETAEEVVGAVSALRSLAVKVPVAPEGAVDVCGTGGDGSNSFNISTVTAIVVAGAGVPVAKAGNRAASSQCGSAEVLEELGIDVDLSPQRMAAAVAEVGIGFLYARACHPAMARVAPIRSVLRIPTIFNLAGPLSNPMGVQRYLIGVGRPELLRPMFEILVKMKVESAWVVHGVDGLDEMSISADTAVLELRAGKVTERTLHAGEFVPRGSRDALRGGDAPENAEIARAILAGETGPRRDVVLLNAAGALCAAGRCERIEDGLEQAAQSIDSGAARERLERWVQFTREPTA